MVGLSFRALLQLTTPLSSSFVFQNKMNLATTVAVLFILVFYCFGFYLIAYRYCQRRQSEIIMNNEVNLCPKSFFCQSICRIARNLIRGCLHAYLLKNYKAQIISLTVFDLISAITTLIFKKNFSNYLIYILFACYYFSFLIFDSILTIRYLCPYLFTP